LFIGFEECQKITFIIKIFSVKIFITLTIISVIIIINSLYWMTRPTHIFRQTQTILIIFDHTFKWNLEYREYSS